VARGVIVALVVISLAGTAHLLGGGRPDVVTPGFAVVSLACVAGCAALSHREWTLIRLLLCLTATQVVFHVVLAAEHGAAQVHLVVTGADMVGTTHLPMVGTTHLPMVAATGMAGGGAEMPAISPAMLATHAGAVLLSALLLRHGEQIQLRIVELVTGLLRGFAIPVRRQMQALGVPRAVADTSALLQTRTRPTPVSRRGPPRGQNLTGWSTAATTASTTAL
jgi:hypothetical protein